MTPDNQPVTPAAVPLTPEQKATQFKKHAKTWGTGVGSLAAGVAFQAHGGFSKDMLNFVVEKGLAVALIVFGCIATVIVWPTLKSAIERIVQATQEIAESMKEQASAQGTTARHQGDMVLGMSQAKAAQDAADADARQARAGLCADVQSGRGENTKAHAELMTAIQAVQTDLTRTLQVVNALFKLAQAEEGPVVTDRVGRAMPAPFPPPIV